MLTAPEPSVLITELGEIGSVAMESAVLSDELSLN